MGVDVERSVPRCYLRPVIERLLFDRIKVRLETFKSKTGQIRKFRLIGADRVGVDIRPEPVAEIQLRPVVMVGRDARRQIDRFIQIYDR